MYDGAKRLGHTKWQAHLQLAETIHTKIQELLNKTDKSLDNIDGIICFKGPGSFTGLRIGLSVANALAYSLRVPIVARKNKNWLESGIKDLLAGQDDKVATPFYDRPVATTPPKQ